MKSFENGSGIIGPPIRDADCGEGIDFEGGDYFLIDKDRSVIIRHSGLRYESGLFEVSIFYDPVAHIADNGVPSLSKEAVSLFTLTMRARKQAVDQSLIIEIDDLRRELDIVALMRHLNMRDRQEALLYRDCIISSQAELKAWDDELGSIGSLRSLNPIHQFVFVLKVENTTSKMVDPIMSDKIIVIRTRSVKL